MRPIEYGGFLAEVKDALRNELDSNDFSFDLGAYKQSFPERSRKLVLEYNRIAEVSFKAVGFRRGGGYFTPTDESGEITVGITHVVVWDAEGKVIYELRALYPYCDSNSFTIKY